MILSRANGSGSTSTSPNSALDASDRTILSKLQGNGRISFRDLAKAVNLSANATAERVRRLEALGIIRGYTVQVSLSALGFPLQAFVDVKLQKGVSMEAFEKALRGVKGVQEAASVTGQFDARIRVVCRDPDDLGFLIEEIRAKTGAQETSSTVICRELILDPAPGRLTEPAKQATSSKPGHR